MKTSELTGAALDWAVAKAEGVVSDDIDDFCLSVRGEYAYSTDWAQGGQIIERERIRTWEEDGKFHADTPRRSPYCWFTGSTPLIAAMRTLVASKLGDDVDIPEELLK